MGLIVTPKNCDTSVKKAIQQIAKKLGQQGVPIFSGLTLSKVCTLATGLNVLRATGLQTDDTALTGTLRGAYIDVSNGSTVATGTIRGMELKARTEAPGDTGNNVAVLEGLSISADSKAHSVTTMRAAEFILDGKTAGTIDEAVGLRIANNLQVDKATVSYGLQIYRDSFDYTADIQLSNGATIGTLASGGLDLRLSTNNYLYIGNVGVGGDGRIYSYDPDSANHDFIVNAKGTGGIFLQRDGGGSGGVYFYNGAEQKLFWFGGATYGEFRGYDQDYAEWIQFACVSGYGYLEVKGTSPNPLILNNSAESDVWLFQASASGETQGLRIYGYKAGDAKRYLDITTGGSANDTVDFTGLSNYKFGGAGEFTGLTLSGLTQGSVVFAGASGVLSQDNDKLFWDATNFRLGIGTSSPGSKLHINSTASASTTLLTLESDINNTNEYNEILFKVVGGQNYGAIRSHIGGTAGDSYMSFFTTTDGGTLARQVTIQHNGKVGFGTYNPETLLTMVSAAPYLTLYNNTEEDSDGGGESRLIYKRERSGGEPTAAFQFEASHDGSSDDQLGRGIWSVNTGAGLVEGMRLDSSLTATFAGVVQATDFAKTGWPIVTGATFSFDNATKVFTVTDGGSAYYYIGGVKYILGGNKTVDLDDIGIAEGLWHIYFDGATLTASQAIWSFLAEDKALVAILYWDATNNKEIFLGWEAHTFHMSGATHARLHYAGGARWEIGLLVSDAGSENVNVSAGDIWDEDLNIPITDGAGSALFEQVLSPAQLPIYYRDGASAWRKYEIGDKAAVADVGYLSGGDLKWNDATTTWSNETVGLNNYVAYYVVATNEQTEPIALIMGQRVDNKLTEAKVNNVFAGLSLAGLPFEEMVVLARLILKDTGTYTLEEVLDLRAYNVKGNITSPLITQHAGLGGLNWSSSGHYFDAAVDFNAQNISNIGTVGCGIITQSGSTLAATYQPLDAELTSLAALSYVAASFVKMTGANTFALRTIGETADDLQGTIDHDLTANYVADKHVAHAGVSITAGKGLSGGGTIASTRNIALDLTEMTGNVVWNDGTTDASITWTYALSGANDPVWTIGSNSMDLTTGVLKVGGTTVMLIGGAPTAHVHDGDTLQHDAVNSSAGAFSFTTGGTVTFSQGITMSAGMDLTIAGHIIFNTDNSYIGFTNPRITFNDTNDRLDITGGIIGSATAAFEGASVTVGKASTTTGTLVLHDSNSANTITLTVPDISAGSLSFTLPPTDGDNLDVLQTNGSGVLTWVANAGGGATIALDNLASVAINTSLISDTADTDSLGSATKEWLNLYIGNVGKIYLGLGQDLSIHRSGANEMTLTASSRVVISGSLLVGGVIEIGDASVDEGELEILDGCTCSTTQLNYLNQSGGTTGTNSTNIVFSTSPTLVTPDLGTPSAIVCTNASGTAASLTAGAVSTITGLAPDTATTQATQVAITTCANLVTVGTIATGVWEGTSIAVSYTDAKCTDALADQTSVNETSHALVLVDGDFGSAGLMNTDGAGIYSIKAIGTDVQAYHANLAAIVAGTWVGANSITTLGTIATVGAITGQSTATFEGASVTIGKASTTTGTLILHDSNSANTITLTVPDISAGSLSFTLPPTDGDNTNVLQTDGNGVLTWVAAGHVFLPFVNYNLFPDNISTSPSLPFTAGIPYNMTPDTWSQAVYVFTTNDASNYWTISLINPSASITYASFDTRADGITTWTVHSVTSFSPAVVNSSEIALYIYAVKTGSPGNLALGGPGLTLEA